MATLNADNPTLLDLAKITEPDGKVATVAEIMSQTNDILDDMTWQNGNLPTGHLFTARTGLPTPTWRKLNGGVAANKGTTAQATANCGMLEAYAEVDKKLVAINGNTAAFRTSEDRAHIEGINQELATTLFFGNEATAPEKFTGLASHYNDLSADNAENIIAAGGAGTDNTSIWLVVWSPETIFGIVPKGSQAGLQVTDLGEDTKVNSDGSMLQVLRTHYTLDAGLVVKDWRFGVRICNIDKSLLSTTWNAGAFASGANLPDLMFQALSMVPNLAMGRAAFYMSRNTLSYVRRQLTAMTNNSTLTTDNAGGKFVERFQGVPMRRVDALAADEALVA